MKIVLIGGTEDKELVSLILSPDNGDIYDSMGELSIRQSAEIIRRARLLVTNDSAPTHMGVAVGTPVLTLYGSTAPVFGFYPYGKRNRILELPDLDCRPCTDHGKKKCPLGHFKCMLDLTPETVFKTVMEMLHGNNTD
jgi:heptosyltransferase-2